MHGGGGLTYQLVLTRLVIERLMVAAWITKEPK